MLLTEKLRLKKPQNTESCNIEDLNYNMDKIDSDIIVLKEHSKQSVCSEEGVHGMRYIEDDLQVYGEYGWYSLINETQYQAPGNLQKFEVIAGDEKAKIKFLEPKDVIEKGIAVCKVVGVMIRYSTDSYPTTIKEGKLVIDNKELGKYENEAYVLEGLTNKTKYYFSAFAYSSENLYNLKAGNGVCTPIGKGRLEIRSPKTCTVKLISNEEQQEITITENQPYIAKYIGGTQITIKPVNVEGRFMLEGGGNYMIEGDETTTVNLNVTEIPNTLNECSWYLIKKISDARQMKKFFKIGDEKITGSNAYPNKYKLARADNEKTRFINLYRSRFYIDRYIEPYNYIPRENEIMRIRKVSVYKGNYYGYESYMEPDNNTDPTKFLSYQLGYKVDNSPNLIARAYGFDIGDCLEDFLGELPNERENMPDESFLVSSGIKNVNGKIQIFAENYDVTYKDLKRTEGEIGNFYPNIGRHKYTFVIEI